MRISIPHREKCSDNVQGYIVFQWLLTGFLFLHSKLMPVGFHPIPQCHPQFRLLLWRHDLPSLLNACQRWVRDSVSYSMTPLLLLNIKYADWCGGLGESKRGAN